MTNEKQELKDDPLTPEKWREIINPFHASEFMDKYREINSKGHEIKSLRKKLDGEVLDYNSPEKTIKNGKTIIEIGNKYKQIHNQRKKLDEYSSKLIKLIQKRLQLNEEDLSKIIAKKDCYGRSEIYSDLETIAIRENYDLLFSQNKENVLRQTAYEIRKNILRKFEYKPNSDAYDLGWATLKEDR